MRTLLIIFLAISFARAQDTTRVKAVVVDTIVVEKNSFVLLPDSAFFTDRDTVIYVVDTIRSNLEAIIKQDNLQDSAFYNDLRRKMGKGKISRKLFDALFDLDNGKQKNSPPQTTPSSSLPSYEGNIVGNVYLKKIDVFGPSVTDTTRQANNRLSRFYNSIHIHTHDRVLRNNLPLKKGDVLTDTKLADNERIIRSLRFIRDARLLVLPRSNDKDTVDLLLLTEDVIPYSFSGRPRGWIAGSVSVSNNNILGTGHELENTLIVEPESPQTLGYEGVYNVPNIRGSFVQAQFRYSDTNFNDVYSGSIERPFYLPDIRYAGGAEISYQRLTTFAPWVDSYAAIDTFTDARELPLIRYRFFQQDYWLARSFYFSKFDNRTRLAVGLNYEQRQFDERPEVSATDNTAYHHRQQWLGSIAFSRRYYTTEKLVYTYGRTEDIPVGQLAELIVGPEFGEYYNRWYTGLEYARGAYITPLGYIAATVRGGGFWRHRRMEDGLLQFSLNSYSYLFYVRRTRYRFFFNIDYTRGIRRLPTIDFRQRYINIRRDQGIRGLSENALEGDERLAFSLEGVVYPPVMFYSFQVAMFGFLDTGFIAEADEAVLKTSPYHGIGIGFRIRNENLAFKTFQVRMIVYPNVPEGASWIGFSAGSIPLPRLRDFVMRRPRVFRFE